MNKKYTIKALSLISGGLDSLLATKLILEQGIYVEGINFYSGFFGECPAKISDRFIAKNKQNKSIAKFSPAWVAEQLGIKLNIIDVIEEFKQVLFHPKFGYGAHLNPCLDCKVFMVNCAKKWMLENGFDFLITGEVLGQRPMSQRKDTLPIVAKNMDDLLLRPLCAKLLEPTLPEKNGWVKRELLCDISGRNRKPQIELAKHFGFNEYPQPAGGCLLTDQCFCNRIQDLWQNRETKDYTLEEIMLLKVGRHLRPATLPVSLKLIVGRDEEENNFLEAYKNKLSFQTENFPGALILLDCDAKTNSDIKEEDLHFIARIAGRFSQGKNAKLVEVAVNYPNGEKRKLSVPPLPTAEISEKWYI